MLIVVNNSTSNLYLRFGGTASSTDFTYLLAPAATWEMTPTLIYTGVVVGVWATAVGAALVTEL